MKPVIYLRIAAVLTAIHAALHTIGGVFGKPTPGPATTAVLAMKANQFVALGHMRTYWEFYRGMGLAVAIFLTIEAVVFWQLGSLSRKFSLELRPVLATFMVGYLCMAVNSYLYFFSAPVIVEGLIALCLALAIFTAPSSVSSEGIDPRMETTR